MIFRNEYMEGKATHREYYAQFVDDLVKARVIQNIGIERLKVNKDEHLNNIPIYDWDALSGGNFIRGGIASSLTVPKVVSEKFKAIGQHISPSDMVCVYKEAARQILESLK